MTASPQRRDPFVGIVLDDQYELVELLARGGMGRIYRGIQRSLQREVAVKVLDMEQLDGKAARADFEQRFFLEAASLARLKHPNTVVVYDYGRAESEDVFYIVMELLEGATLDDLLEREGSLDPTRAIHIALQVAGSLSEAHELGLVHRDLKPSNIILGRRGADSDFVKVLDFGLVKADDTKLTQSGALLGTPRYMAPEQIANEDVGPAADVYGLGATLYNMLTGRPPFESDSKFVLLAAHMNVAVPTFAEVAPEMDLGADLEATVMRCLEKEPAARFSNMEALARALSFAGETTTAASSMPGSRVSLPARVDVSGVEPVGAVRPAAPSARKVLLVALLAGALLAIGVALWLQSRRERPPVAETPGVTEPQPPGEPAEAASPVAGEEDRTDEEAGGEDAMTRVTLDTVPSGAHLRRNGRDLGDAPATLLVPRDEVWEIEVSMDGYESRQIAVTGGQEAISVNLDRARRGRRRATSMATAPGPAEEPAMVEAPMEATTTAAPPTMERQSENRDPWAR